MMAASALLRVASFNIRHGVGHDGTFDLCRTAETIRRTGADIIGLNEVDKHWGDRSQWQNEPAQLADMLQMRVHFAGIYDLAPPAADAPRREYGLAILSRYPITSATNHSITRRSSQDGDLQPGPMPGFLEAVVDVGGILVHIYATHLDSGSDPGVRKIQVSETLDIVAGRDDAPQVLIGDFNAPPDAGELAPLWNTLTDMWSEAGIGAGYTFPATDPQKRIDYITVSADIAAGGRCCVLQTEASDHQPVIAQLSISNPRSGSG